MASILDCKVIVMMARAHASNPNGWVALIMSATRCIRSGLDNRKPSVNHRAMVPLAMAVMPPFWVMPMRSSQAALPASSTKSRQLHATMPIRRSPWCTAISSAVMPPSEMPTINARATLNSSSTATASLARSPRVALPFGVWLSPWPRVS